MSEIEHFGPVCLSPNHTVFLKIVTILLFSPKAPREGDRKENQGMNVADTIKKFGLEQAFDYLYRDPERNLLKIMDWADRFDNGDFAVQRKVIRQAIEDPSHPYHQYILHIVQDVDPEVMKTVAVNLFINASMIGWRKQEVCRAQYQCNMPFNENMLQPYPMLENPERLRKMVLDSEAHSTDPQSPESADHLCGKCDAYARHWAPEAQRLWAERKQELGL